eukprot:CAMPEP_0184872740 /NCGR_PEP_ID=MMETSP0580-20130426/41461_1 /TAXON_ID=1118495 /ORGANISM="Dactyliosolen fragilissimus" /LENGTH=264 /DNA_ID=CAMNT_0027375579 /DNA_START=258 /DNA_END=1052 /DNA_ORIENTATION=-
MSQEYVTIENAAIAQRIESISELDQTDQFIHEYFMGIALEEAMKAKKCNEVPIGAIITNEVTEAQFLGASKFPMGNLLTKRHKISANTGNTTRYFQILSRGKNQVEILQDASAHAELQAMRSAASSIQNWRLLNSTLYSTLEPCPMCLASAQAFRVKNVVWGANDLRLGAVETHMNLLDIAKHPFHDNMTTVGGVRKQESSDLLIDFFKERRKKSGRKKKGNKKSIGATNVTVCDKGIRKILSSKFWGELVTRVFNKLFRKSPL